MEAIDYDCVKNPEVYLQKHGIRTIGDARKLVSRWISERYDIPYDWVFENYEHYTKGIGLDGRPASDALVVLIGVNYGSKLPVEPETDALVPDRVVLTLVRAKLMQDDPKWPKDQKVTIASGFLEGVPLLLAEKKMAASWRSKIKNQDRHSLGKKSTTFSSNSNETKNGTVWLFFALLLGSIASLLFGYSDPDDLPDGYFILVRFLVTATCAWIGILRYRHDSSSTLWIVCAIFVGIYNPFFPLGLGRDIWLWVNTITLIFLVSIFFYNPKKGEK